MCNIEWIWPYHLFSCIQWLFSLFTHLDWLCEEDGRKERYQHRGDPFFALNVLEHDAVERYKGRWYQYSEVEKNPSDYHKPPG